MPQLKSPQSSKQNKNYGFLRPNQTIFQ